MRKLLEAGATVDAENDYRMTPLFRASRAGSAEAVRLLLEHGADPRHVDHTGAGPLSEAALSRSRACVALLIEHGAPVGGADTVMRWTPLHLAAQLGYRDVAEVLVDAGGPLDALDADGRTPLGEAAAHGHAGLVLLMLPHGVDPDLAAPGHATPFVEAADGGHEDVVRALLDKTKALDPALVAAAGAGFEDVVARLLGRGAQAGATDAKGASALERAAGSGHLAIVRRLVAAGVDLGRCGGRALGAAAEAGCLEIVAFLLDAKVPVDARGADDPTALMRAAGSGWEAVVRLLLDRGADRKATSARGGDIEAAMAASEKAISARLEALRASRAWHPEEEQLPGELRELQASHERIRKLLAR